MTGMSKIAAVVGVDAPTRLNLARWLAGFGIDSLYFEDESDALAVIDTVKPDVVMLADGAGAPRLLELVAQTSNLRKLRGTRVMVCARKGDAALLGAAVAEGADECLVSPFDADILKFKLEQTGVLAAQ